jgi:hypothetical protein
MTDRIESVQTESALYYMGNSQCKGAVCKTRLHGPLLMRSLGLRQVVCTYEKDASANTNIKVCAARSDYHSSEVQRWGANRRPRPSR